MIHITLFDAQGRPTCERLVFVDNPNNNLQLKIDTPLTTVPKRKKVSLKLAINNTQGKSTPSSLSMSIRDLKAFPYNRYSGNIKTWLLLNSDLRGEIKNPGYFFEKENDSRRRYLLDLVMITHGWRRFTWTTLLNNPSQEQKIKPEIGLYISGKTQQLKKPYKPFSAPTRLTFYGKTIFQEPIKKSDTLGQFKFGPYIFLDSMPVIIESRIDKFKSTKRKSRNVVILVDRVSKSPKVEKNVFFNKRINKNKNLEIANFIKVTQYIKEEKTKYNQEVQRLNQINLIAKRKTEFEKRRDQMNELTNYGSPLHGQRVDVLSDVIAPGSYTALDLVSQMRGIFTRGDSVYVRKSNHVAKIVLDGLEIDGSFLTAVNGEEISFIDVLTGADAATFSNAANGVVALYSNTGNVASRNIKRKPGIIDFKAKGFYSARKFYSPDHVNDFELLAKQDLRTTLHWEPSIRITNTGTTEISFYTSDIESDYIIEVEGISDNGVPIHGTRVFNVE